ncbi:MAG: Dabb family protein [Paracoccus sp. (in: a-proteobacteria)]
MIRHITLICFRDDISEACIAGIIGEFDRICRVLPGLIGITAGRSESPQRIERRYLHGCVADFTDRDALAACQAHPDCRHVSDMMIENTVGGLDGILVFDLSQRIDPC